MSNTRENAVRYYIDQVKSNLSSEIKELIRMAKHDLREGPLYLDEDGDWPVSAFDEGAVQFDFASAVDKISEALEEVGEVYVDDDGVLYLTDPVDDDQMYMYEDEDGEYTDEEPDDGAERVYTGPETYYRLDRPDVILEIVGRDLAEYVK